MKSIVTSDGTSSTRTNSGNYGPRPGKRISTSSDMLKPILTDQTAPEPKNASAGKNFAGCNYPQKPILPKQNHERGHQVETEFSQQEDGCPSTEQE